MATIDTINSNLITLGFNNPSNAAIISKMANAFAGVVDITLNEFQNTQSSILNIINTQRYGKSGYYTSKALAFQYGYSLSIDPITLDYVYTTIDATAQIITQAAFLNIGGQLFLKIATSDTLGNLIPLSTAQFSAFSNYFLNFQIPGLPVTIISNAGNILNFNAVATYYATYDLPTLQTAILSALTSFRKSFAFNGVFFAGDLQDYIKAQVPGIRDFFINNTQIDRLAFAGNTNLDSGYFNYIVNIQNNVSYIAV